MHSVYLFAVCSGISGIVCPPLHKWPYKIVYVNLFLLHLRAASENEHRAQVKIDKYTTRRLKKHSYKAIQKMLFFYILSDLSVQLPAII